MIITNLNLQALRITAGWTVEINKFYEIDPIGKVIELKVKDVYVNDGWLLFEKAMFFAVHKRFKLKLELEWRPPCKPNGEFWLTLLKKDDWQNPIVQIQTKSKSEVIEKMNELFNLCSLGYFENWYPKQKQK